MYKIVHFIYPLEYILLLYSGLRIGGDKMKMPLTEGSTLWFIEGLATTITHQYDHLPLETTCNIEDITNQKVGYNTYRTLMTYLLQEYGQEFLLNILDKKDVQENLLPTICEEINHKSTLKK